MVSVSQAVILFAILVSILASEDAGDSDIETRRIGYFFPTPFLGTVAPNAGGVVAPTTVPPGMVDAFMIVCLDLINAMRVTHQAPQLTWNATLATQAEQCANQRQRANDVTTPICQACGPAAETTGFSSNMAPSQRCRGVIQDPVQFSWFSQYTMGNLDFANPVFTPMNAEFVQMIWIPTTQVGCGTSRTTAMITNPMVPSPTQYILSCCWDQGVVPSTIATNIREDLV